MREIRHSLVKFLLPAGFSVDWIPHCYINTYSRSISYQLCSQLEAQSIGQMADNETASHETTRDVLVVVDLVSRQIIPKIEVNRSK